MGPGLCRFPGGLTLWALMWARKDKGRVQCAVRRVWKYPRRRRFGSCWVHSYQLR